MAALLAGCDKTDSGAGAAQTGLFGALFEGHCGGCHGKEGLLGPAPPLNDPVFAVLVPQQVLEETIHRGRPGRLMPAWSKSGGGPLSDEQINTLITEIRSCGRPEAAAGLPPYFALPGQVGNASRGREIFNIDCADCHGQDGRGGSKAGPLNEAAFLQLIGPQELRRIAITGRPDLGMPDVRIRAQQAGRRPLHSQQIQDVVAWVGSLVPQATASGPQGTLQEDWNGRPDASGTQP